MDGAFALTLARTLRTRLVSAWATAAAVLLTTGWYFAVCSDWHLTQIEGLAGFPLWLTLWCAVRGAESPRGGARWWLAAGLAGGVALTMKLLLAPLVLAIFVVPAVLLARGAGGPIALLRAALAALVGLALPLVLLALDFAAHHALGLAWFVTMIYPTQVLRLAHGFRFNPFFDGLRWFAATWAPMLPLAALGAWCSLRPRLEPIGAALVTWAAGAVVVILAQRLSYWEYQYLLLSVPVALLAVRGLVALAPVIAGAAPGLSPLERRFALASVLVVLMAPPLVPSAARAVTLVHHRLGLTAADRHAYQLRVSFGEGYSKIGGDLAPLQGPTTHPGKIWVLGNPLYYWLSGREPAVPRNGASFIEFMTPAEWDALTVTLDHAAPAYIHVQHQYDVLLGPTHPESHSFVAWLGGHYTPIAINDRGTWYAPRPEVR